MKKLALILMAAIACVACNKTAEKKQTTPAEEVVVVEEAVAEVPEAVEKRLRPKIYLNACKCLNFQVVWMS